MMYLICLSIAGKLYVFVAFPQHRLWERRREYMGLIAVGGGCVALNGNSPGLISVGMADAFRAHRTSKAR